MQVNILSHMTCSSPRLHQTSYSKNYICSHVSPKIFCYRGEFVWGYIIGILQEYYRQQCVSMILSLFRDYTLLLVTLIMKVILLCRVYKLQYSIELSIYSI